MKHVIHYHVEKFKLKWERQNFYKNDKVGKKAEEEELTYVKKREEITSEILTGQRSYLVFLWPWPKKPAKTQKTPKRCKHKWSRKLMQGYFDQEKKMGDIFSITEDQNMLEEWPFIYMHGSMSGMTKAVLL